MTPSAWSLLQSQPARRASGVAAGTTVAASPPRATSPASLITAPVQALSAAAQSLFDHPHVAHIDRGLAALTRNLYGRTSQLTLTAAHTLVLHFEEVQVSVVDLSLVVRCGGHEFALQVVNPAAVVDLGLALAPQVPAPLQRAAFLAATYPLWSVLETWVGAPIELVHLQGPSRALASQTVLGLTVHLVAEAAVAQPSSSFSYAQVLLRATDQAGWQALLRGAVRVAAPSTQQDVFLNCWIHAEPVPLTAQELSELAPGDVVVLAQSSSHSTDQTYLDPKAHTRSQWQLAAQLRLGSELQMLAELQLQKHGEQWVASVTRPARSTTPPTLRTDTMTSAHSTDSNHPHGSPPSAHASTDATLQSVKVDLHIELAKMSVPLSTLQQLSAGQVLDTQQPIDGHSVVLWCGGHRLGIGQLVAVGDRVGVMVVALTHAAAPNASA